MQWVVNVYTLTIAAFILLAGQLADRFGRKQVYLAGLAIFTLASLGAGLAPSGPLLIAARAVQGLGAALVTPTALAIIADAFPRRQRGLAIGIWAGVSASALGLGPLFGAIILDDLGWRWIFLVNVPIGVGAWLVARAVLRDSSAPRPALHLDTIGAALSGAGLLTLLLGLTQGNGAGWLSVRVVVLFAAAVVCAALFVRHEQLAAEPLLEISLVQGPGLRRCEHPDPARHLGDVQPVLLPCPLHASRPRLHRTRSWHRPAAADRHDRRRSDRSPAGSRTGSGQPYQSRWECCCSPEHSSACPACKWTRASPTWCPG